MDSNEQKLIDAGYSCDLSVGWVCSFHMEFTEYKKAVQAHTNALIAAAIEECAKTICCYCKGGDAPVLTNIYGRGFSWMHRANVQCAANEIRSLTPPAICRALELREVMTRLEEARKLWHEDFIEAYNGGTLTAQGREILQKRIAVLEVQAKR